MCLAGRGGGERDMRTKLLTAAALCALAGSAMAQSRTGGGNCNVMVPDSTNNRIMLFSGSDGSLINDNFIDLSGAGAVTPINAVMIQNEIWVSDQLTDSIYRYTNDGTTLLGTITGAMDNIRGLALIGDTVYVTNGGTDNGAAMGLVTIDVNTNTITGNFATGDTGAGNPFDVLDYFGNILVDDIDGDDIDTFSTGGSYLSTFVESDGVNGIDFPEQMNATSMGNVLVGGFSAPDGIYEYDHNGNLVNHYDVGSTRGVFELENGNILFTNTDGVHVLDPVSGMITHSITGVSARYAECYTVIPTPGSLGLLGLAGLAATRRRR